MFKALRFRFGFMFFVIFLAFFFDPLTFEFKWDMQSGICNEYDFGNRQCRSGENLITFPKFVALIDIPTIIFIWGITFCGAYSVHAYKPLISQAFERSQTDLQPDFCAYVRTSVQS